MKRNRVLCLMLCISLLLPVLSACSGIEARPFPGLESTGSSQETLSTALTEAVTELPTEASSETEPEETALSEDFPEPPITPDALETQLQLLLTCVDLWRYEASPTEMCSYCVTDLDHNGRLEILMSSISSTGYISYTQCQEVNETLDGLTDCITQDLGADIQPMQTLICYTDGKEFCYAVNDKLQSGWQELVIHQISMKLSQGKLTEQKLASASNITTLSSADIQTSYTDANGGAITRDAYERIFETTFAGWTKAEIGLGWIGGNYGTPGLDMLRASYESFTVIR